MSLATSNTAERIQSILPEGTEIKTERTVYKWTIKDFNNLTGANGQCVCSTWFNCGEDGEKWRLNFYPRGMNSNNVSYVSLFLQRESPRKLPVFAHVELMLMKSNKIMGKRSFANDYNPQQGFGFVEFVERSKLLTLNFSEDNLLTIRCLIDIRVKAVIPQLEESSIFPSKANALIKDIRSLFEDPIFTDFTIIVGDQKFPTHKNILAKRSPVFAAMFQHEDMEENRKNEVQIVNIDAIVVKGMLEYIYTDEVMNLKELAGGLLVAADRYDLDGLRVMYEKTLYEELGEENAAEILQLADVYHADSLKEYVLQYIVDHSRGVIESENWGMTGLSTEVLREVIDMLVLSQGYNESINCYRATIESSAGRIISHKTIRCL